ERRPETREAAAHDGHVRLHIALERRRLLDLPDLVEPPGRKAGLYSFANPALRARVFWKMMFAIIPPTATTKIAVPMTLICGGSATRAAPHTNKGNVVVAPELKYVITKSSTESANASSAAEMIPGAMSGSVTLPNVVHSFAPRSIAASSRWRSKPTSRAFTVTTTYEMLNITCAMKIVTNPST